MVGAEADDWQAAAGTSIGSTLGLGRFAMPHEDADHLVTVCLEQMRRDAAIDAPRHGQHDT